MKKIAIFASGNGTNAENIATLFNQGTQLRVDIVLYNRKNAGVAARMLPLGVETLYVPNSIWDNEPGDVVGLLKERGIDLIVLAGFMHYLSPVIIDAYRGRILNIHPSLLPAYGGKGMYGHHVHEAVVANGEKESGVTVHLVTEEVDGGEIVMQERVEVLPEDTAETLEAKIHPIEYKLYPRAIMAFAERMDEQERRKSNDEEWADALHIQYDKEKGIPEPPKYRETASYATPGYQPQQPQPAAPRFTQQPPRYGEQEPPFTTESSRQQCAAPKMPPTYMWLSILVTLLCCLPLGIVAIIYSGMVSSKYSLGDYEGAEKASRTTEIWIIASFCLGILSNTLYLPLMLI